MKSAVCGCFSHSKAGNEELAASLTQWLFKEKGVLRVGKIEHHREGEKHIPDYYTVMEDLVGLLNTGG